jgi:hypothetical protein
MQKCDHDIGFKKTHFYAENWQKSQKIVIITSTPGGLVLQCRSLDPSFARLTKGSEIQVTG